MVRKSHDGHSSTIKLVSTSYADTGRTSQKRRTRQALVEAARSLVAEGAPPTVEAAAARAGVARTTAYRYFRNQAELLVAAHPETAAVSLLPQDAPPDAAARLDLVLHAFIQLVLDTEPQQRAMLHMSLGSGTPELPLRQGRAISWIGEALEPATGPLGAAAVKRLTLAIRSATGVEALAWLTDVAGLDRDDAAELMRWAGGAMLRQALAGEPPPPPRRRPRSESSSRDGYAPS